MSKQSDKDPVIPRSAISEGIRLALDRARTFLEDAKALAQSGHWDGAAALLSQGVEEFGKAVMLKETLEGGGESPVRVQGFRDHQMKLRKAAEVLPPDSLKLGGVFDAEMPFDANVYFGESSAEDWAARLELLYTDWDDSRGKWKGRLQIDRTILQSVSRALACVETKRAEWTEHA